MTDQVINIVADIGGTNLRIGIVDDKGNVDLLTVYQCSEFTDLCSIVQTFLVEKSIISQEINACFAIACPVDNDLIKMTNLPWEFSKSELQAALGFRK